MSYLSEALYEAISARSRLMARLDSTGEPPRISVSVLMHMAHNADTVLDMALSDAVSTAVRNELAKTKELT